MRILKYNENRKAGTIEVTVALTPKEFDATDVRTLDVGQLRHAAKSRLDADAVMGIVYDYYSISDELRQSMANPDTCNRIKRWVEVRRMCFYFLKKYTTLSLQAIGNHYGQGHSNVLHHIRKIDDWLEINDSKIETEVYDLDVLMQKTNELLIEELC